MNYLRVGSSMVYLFLSIVLFSNSARAEVTYNVASSHGVVQGLDEQGIAAFRGIPYAQAPIGPLRWLPPRAAVAYNGVL